VIEVVGFAGAALYLVGYGLLSFGRLGAQTVLYQVLNLTGGIGVAANALYHDALPSLVVNIAWCSVAVAALVRIAQLHRRRRSVDVPE